MFADDTCYLDFDADLNNVIQRINAEINKIAFGSGPVRWP